MMAMASELARASMGEQGGEGVQAWARVRARAMVLVLVLVLVLVTASVSDGHWRVQVWVSACPSARQAGGHLRGHSRDVGQVLLLKEALEQAGTL